MYEHSDKKLDSSSCRFDVQLDLTTVLCKLIDKVFEYVIDKINEKENS